MAVQRGIDKWKMKKWFTVRAPKAFNEAGVGEMPANDEKAAVGRNVTVSLASITNNPSHAYTNVVLKITGVKGESAETRLVRLELLQSYLRSFVRRYRSVSSAVIPATSKDGVPAVLKLIVVTRARATHTRIMGMRKEMNEFTGGYFRENGMDQIVSAVVDGKFQAELAAKLDHITDLSKVEVRKLEIK